MASLHLRRRRDSDVESNRVAGVNWSLFQLYSVYTIEQTSSKLPANVFKILVLIARRFLDRVNTLSLSTFRQPLLPSSERLSVRCRCSGQ